jgi:hypothetical protein
LSGYAWWIVVQMSKEYQIGPEVARLFTLGKICPYPYAAGGNDGTIAHEDPAAPSPT